MKVIISHDVDHLYRNDHLFDLIYPKLWVRSTIEVIKKQYGIKEYFYRMLSPFEKRRNRIEEVMEFDSNNNIPSTFFFGMESGLGMNYSQSVAAEMIKYVKDMGFDVGVHGIEYRELDNMRKEARAFNSIVNNFDFGIRMHYVRFDNKITLKNLDKCGYIFDSSEFDKNKGFLIKKPYKVNNIWEFPLTIMDGYLPPKIEDKIQKTKKIINDAKAIGLPYITILFHDVMFSNGYDTDRKWYLWLVDYLKENNFEFISYKDAIKELEGQNE